MKENELSWLSPLADAWLGAARRGRLPHAVLLTGSRGVGKRAAAVWMAMQRLAIDVPPLPSFEQDMAGHGGSRLLAAHPDMRWVRPLEGKRTIHIDQIRELVTELSLTSYEGGAKVAIIEPADTLTANAANSLLKTLEDPPGDALLLLVADRMGTLPATILSRCQRLNIPTPPESVSLAWLARLKPGAQNWAAALRMAGNAPLAAVAAVERLDVTEAMARDFAQVAEGRLSPMDVAARWTKYGPDFALVWLTRQVHQCVYWAMAGGGESFDRAVAESVLNRIDRRNLFCYLDLINQIRSQPAGFDVQLALESLLIEWAQGLQNCGNKFTRGGLLPIPDGKVNA